MKSIMKPVIAIVAAALILLGFKAGLAAAYEIGKELGRKPLFVVGRDTRISGDMILASLTAVSEP